MPPARRAWPALLALFGALLLAQAAAAVAVHLGDRRRPPGADLPLARRMLVSPDGPRGPFWARRALQGVLGGAFALAGLCLWRGHPRANGLALGATVVYAVAVLVGVAFYLAVEHTALAAAARPGEKRELAGLGVGRVAGDLLSLLVPTLVVCARREERHPAIGA